VCSRLATIADRYGKVDALLNIAGVARIRRIEEASDDDIAFCVRHQPARRDLHDAGCDPADARAGAGDRQRVVGDHRRLHAAWCCTGRRRVDSTRSAG
jgi:hypothetical protein